MLKDNGVHKMHSNPVESNATITVQAKTLIMFQKRLGVYACY